MELAGTVGGGTVVVGFLRLRMLRKRARILLAGRRLDGLAVELVAGLEVREEEGENRDRDRKRERVVEGREGEDLTLSLRNREDLDRIKQGYLIRWFLIKCCAHVIVNL